MELLVAIGIVCALAAFLVPSLTQARLRAWQAKSSHNLRQLTIANMGYAAENGFFVPADDWWNNRRWCGARSAANQPFDPAKGLLAEYLGKSRRVTPCPLFTHMLSKQKGVSTFEEGSGGYGYNDYIGGGIAPNYTSDAQRLRISLPLARLAHPSTTIMFGTTALAKSGGVQEYPFCHPPYWTDEYGVPQPFYGRPTPSLHFRFNARALVAWCDGHISSEVLEARSVGENPYGGDANKEKLGWFGPDRDNGFWNPDFVP
jgi:hypothetical protein